MKINFTQCLSVKKRFAVSGQQGFTLIEVLVAVALLATMGVGFLSALTTGTNATSVLEKKVDIDWLARTQMEYTKQAPYVSDIGTGIYEEIDGKPGNPYAIPSNYDVVVEASWVDPSDTNIQKITVKIKRGTDTLLVLDGYKVNR